jgi:hypothetical protein
VRPDPWYSVIVTDKPTMYGGTMWVWRIINSMGHIVAEGVGQYESQSAARRASKRILKNVTWMLFP